MFHLTSSLVSSRPVWNCTPLRKFKLIWRRIDVPLHARDASFREGNHTLLRGAGRRGGSGKTRLARLGT